MKYLKQYESFFEAPESQLFNLVWECIDSTYVNTSDLKDQILGPKETRRETEITKETWISFVMNCFSPDDTKQLGTYFIKNFIQGEMNKDLFYFLHKKFSAVVALYLNSFLINRTFFEKMVRREKEVSKNLLKLQIGRPVSAEPGERVANEISINQLNARLNELDWIKKKRNMIPLF